MRPLPPAPEPDQHDGDDDDHEDGDADDNVRHGSCQKRGKAVYNMSVLFSQRPLREEKISLFWFL